MSEELEQLFRETLKEISQQQLNNLAFLTNSIDSRIGEVRKDLQILAQDVASIKSNLHDMREQRVTDILKTKSVEARVYVVCSTIMIGAGAFFAWLWDVLKGDKP